MTEQNETVPRQRGEVSLRERGPQRDSGAPAAFAPTPLLVAAKDLRPGDSIMLPAPSSGEAIERKAHVLEVRRSVTRTVGSGRRIEESDTTTLFYKLDVDGNQAAQAFSSTHQFPLTH